jgi:hypothetical protein
MGRRGGGDATSGVFLSLMMEPYPGTAGVALLIAQQLGLPLLAQEMPVLEQMTDDGSSELEETDPQKVEMQVLRPASWGSMQCSMYACLFLTPFS